MESLQKYTYEENNARSYSEYINLAVFGWEIPKKP
jgi:hypothetical protein